jgi:hypothetical protein
MTHKSGDLVNPLLNEEVMETKTAQVDWKYP